MKIKVWCLDFPTWPELSYTAQTIYDAAKEYANGMEVPWSQVYALRLAVECEGHTAKKVLIEPEYTLRATLLGEVE